MFAGLDAGMKRYIPRVDFALDCMDGFEAAKGWLLGGCCARTPNLCYFSQKLCLVQVMWFFYNEYETNRI